MAGILKKRGRDDQGSADSVGPEPKISCRKADDFFHLLEDMESLDKIQDEECCANEELISRVMRNLEEEIGLTAASLFTEGSSGEESVRCDVSGEEQGFDLCHLLGASDDELGIPPSSLINLDEQHTFSLPLDLGGNQEICSFNGDWFCENNSVDFSQNLDFTLDVRDFVFVEQDYPLAWRLESSHGVY